MAAKSRRPTPAQRRRKPAPADLDEMNAQGNDELHGDAVFSIHLGADGTTRAVLKPPGYSRQSPHAQAVLLDLMRLVSERGYLVAQIEEAVGHLREHDAVSWSTIGWCVGMTSEGARRRFTESPTG